MSVALSSSFEKPKEEETLLFAVRRLRAADPDWFAKYVQRYERDYEVQYQALLIATTDKVLNMQGRCAAMESHLRLLKQAL